MTAINKINGYDVNDLRITDAGSGIVISSAERTKLSGIEALADVTDTANVDAAGATMNTDTSLVGNAWFLDEDNMLSDSAIKVPSQQSVKAYVDNTVASAKAYKGGYDAATNTPDLDTTPIANIKAGHVYDITVGGSFFAILVEVGDTLTAIIDNPTTSAHWVVTQTNLTAASIKTQYESNADTNAFTDAFETKLIDAVTKSGVETLTGLKTFYKGSGGSQETIFEHDSAVAPTIDLRLLAYLTEKKITSTSTLFKIRDVTNAIDMLVLNNGVTATLAGDLAVGNTLSASNLSGTNTGDNSANTNTGLVHTSGSEIITGLKTLDVAGGAQLDIAPTTAGAPTYIKINNTVNVGGKIWRSGVSGAGTAGSFDFYNESDAILGLAILPSGKVGIHESTPLSDLHVKGTLNYGQWVPGTPIAGTFAITSTNDLFGLVAGVNPTGSVWMQAGRTDTATPMLLQINSEGGNVQLCSSGNVSIGSSDAISKLTIVKDLTGGGDATGLRIQTSDGANRNILFGGASSAGDYSSLQSYKEGAGAGVRPLCLNPLGGLVLAYGGINSILNGEALILTNASGGGSPTAQFVSYKNSSGVEKAYVGYGSNTDTFSVSNYVTGGILRLQGKAGVSLQIDNTEVISISAAMNVGIGDSAPTNYPNYSTLSIKGKSNSSGGVLDLKNLDSSAHAQIVLNINALDIQTVTSLPMKFWTNSLERMRIEAGGNVGIGTTSMDSKFEVNSSASVEARIKLKYADSAIAYFGSYLGIVGNGNATDTALYAWTGQKLSLGSNAVEVLEMASTGVSTFRKAVRGSETVLTSSGASIAIDLSSSNDFTHTMTENTTLAAPSNVAVGQSGSIRITQHASAPKTLAYNTAWKFAGGTIPALTATNGAADTLNYAVRSSTFIECNLVKAYA